MEINPNGHLHGISDTTVDAGFYWGLGVDWVLDFDANRNVSYWPTFNPDCRTCYLNSPQTTLIILGFILSVGAVFIGSIILLFVFWGHTWKIKSKSSLLQSAERPYMTIEDSGRVCAVSAISLV